MNISVFGNAIHIYGISGNLFLCTERASTISASPSYMYQSSAVEGGVAYPSDTTVRGVMEEAKNTASIHWEQRAMEAGDSKLQMWVKDFT